MDKTEAPAFDCQSCGACCCVSEIQAAHDADLYVKIKSTDEIARPKNRKVLRQVATYTGQGTWQLKMTKGDNRRCAQLQGTVGEHVACGIYDVRPDNCRWVQVGTIQCVTARRYKGLPVPDDFVVLPDPA